MVLTSPSAHLSGPWEACPCFCFLTLVIDTETGTRASPLEHVESPGFWVEFSWNGFDLYDFLPQEYENGTNNKSSTTEEPKKCSQHVDRSRENDSDCIENWKLRFSHTGVYVYGPLWRLFMHLFAHLWARHPRFSGLSFNQSPLTRQDKGKHYISHRPPTPTHLEEKNSENLMH